MPVVIMPDGTHVEMPDTPPAGGAAPQAPGLLQRAVPYAKDFARGTLKTLGSMGDFGLNLLGMQGQPGERTLTEQAEGVFPISEADKGTGRTYARQALEGAGGAILSPGSTVKNALIGGLAGTAGEAGARVSDGSPIGRIAGTLAGGIAGGVGLNLLRTGSTQEQALARAATENLPAGALEKAQAFQAEAAAKGVNLDLVQALESVGVSAPALQTIRNVLTGSQRGPKVQATLGKQAGQLEMAGDVAIGGLPGAVREEGVAANNLAQAATKRIADAKAERSAAVKALYAKAGELPPAVRKEFANILNDMMTKPGTTAATVAAGEAALARLKAAPSTGAPMSHALDFDTFIGDTVGPYKGTPMTPADPKTLGALKNAAGKMNSTLQQASPELAAAEQRYGQISQDVIDPLKQGPVGQLATPRGYRPDTQASIAKMNSIFSKGTDPQASTSAIRTAGKELNKVDPGAFADAAKTYYSGRLSAAFDGSDNPAAALMKLFTDRKQWQGMKDTAAVVADGAGLNPADVTRGLENFATITKGAANRPAAVTGISPADVKAMGGGTLAGAAMRMVGVAPLKPLASRVEAATLGGALTKFDDILTSPGGAKMLAELGKVSAISPAAQTIIATWAAGVGSQSGDK